MTHHRKPESPKRKTASGGIAPANTPAASLNTPASAHAAAPANTNANASAPIATHDVTGAHANANANAGAADTNTATACVICARVAFFIVFVINVQCAVSFVLWPSYFASAYELSGVAGNAAVQGIGVAFLMWNATYPAFIANPRKFFPLGAIIISQQVIGLAGESFILATLPAQHATLASSITRFIAFDASGLIIMAASFIWLFAKKKAGNAANSARSPGMRANVARTNTRPHSRPSQTSRPASCE